MHKLNTLTKKNRAQHRRERKKVGQGVLPHKHTVRHIVHFHASREVPHTGPVRLIGMRYDNDLHKYGPAYLVPAP